MKKINENQKKIIFYTCIVLVLVAVISAAVLLSAKKESLTPEEQISKYLQESVNAFYQNSYYPGIEKIVENKEDFLKNFTKEGIEMSVTTLLNHNAVSSIEVEKKLVNPETKEKCDLDETKVILYPKEPYKKDSYKLKTIIKCGF